MNYYNTTSESGQMLLNFKNINTINCYSVVEVFQDYPDSSFTPYEIGDELTKRNITMLQSSVKRAITDLTASGHLVNTGVKVVERYGRPNYKWQLNK